MVVYKALKETDQGLFFPTSAACFATVQCPFSVKQRLKKNLQPLHDFQKGRDMRDAFNLL
jgi:hypothetical protein